MHLRAPCFLLSATVWLSACAGGSGTTQSVDVPMDLSDTTAGEVPRTDAAAEGAFPELGWDVEDATANIDSAPDGLAELMDLSPLPGQPGYPCSLGSDCDSDLCIWTPEGKLCSTTCLDECPFGWTCAASTSFGPDPVYLCVPGHVALCRPCQVNKDCALVAEIGAACIPLGDTGSFCGSACQAAEDCPQGYLCAPVDDVNGTLVMQCVLSTGECACSQDAVDAGAETACSVSNEHGTCAGTRHCSAQGLTACSASPAEPEACDLADNDCDGSIDEDLEGQSCTVDNEFGSCKGKTKCVGGDPQCTAKDPEPEACDGIDNDCDGQTDDPYPDSDNDGTADCMETDKDGDGTVDGKDNCEMVPNPGQEDFDLDGKGDLCDLDDDNDLAADDVDCKPFDPTVFPQAAEMCDGIDNDCDKSVDEAFPDLDQDQVADCVDTDDDGDAIPDSVDNCPGLKNPLQTDTDQDSVGDACDDDLDGDGLANAKDNCPFTPNAQQQDADGDGQGDACDNDLDGDLDPDDKDCAPANPAVHHAAVDACNGIDDNCSGAVDEGFPDKDLDGIKDCVDTDDDGDLDPDELDCAPSDPAVHHAAAEKCNALDDDCNDAVDDGLGTLACGKGACFHTLPACINGVLQACDPFQGASLEKCDGLDNDCDGLTDEDASVTWCGVGVCFHASPTCKDGTPLPCDPLAGAGAEVCNGLDDDCDGKVDEGLGSTSCGVGACLHSALNCVDGEPQQCDPLFAASPEKCNGVDDDCNGVVDDGLGQTTCGLGECFHASGNCSGGAPVVCNPFLGAAKETCNGKDDDCNGVVDDGLGQVACGTGACKHLVPACTDGGPSVCDPLLGAADEKCNGIDDDCDGDVDEQLGQLPCGLGACYHLVLACAAGLPGQCNPFEGVLPEQCNGEDDDCNGLADDGLGTTTCGVGPCLHAQPNCVNGVPQPCDPLAGAKEEICNGLDEDCDGTPDDGFLDTDGDKTPDCMDDDDDNDNSKDTVDCAPLDPAIYPGATEVCDLKDNDCDKSVDETCPFVSCAALLAANPGTPSGTYQIDLDGNGPAAPFSIYCDMVTDGGGWARVADDHHVWGTGWDSTARNTQGLTYTEILFYWDHGSAVGGPNYPNSHPDSTPVGFQLGSGGWLAPKNWSASTCGTPVTTVEQTTYLPDPKHIKVKVDKTNATIRFCLLEGLTSCTTSDNPGEAWADILVR